MMFLDVEDLNKAKTYINISNILFFNEKSNSVTSITFADGTILEVNEEADSLYDRIEDILFIFNKK